MKYHENKIAQLMRVLMLCAPGSNPFTSPNFCFSLVNFVDNRRNQMKLINFVCSKFDFHVALFDEFASMRYW